jgi:hypothetical protein
VVVPRSWSEVIASFCLLIEDLMAALLREEAGPFAFLLNPQKGTNKKKRRTTKNEY